MADIWAFDAIEKVILSDRTRIVLGMVTTCGNETCRPGVYILEDRNGLQRGTWRLTVKQLDRQTAHPGREAASPFLAFLRRM